MHFISCNIYFDFIGAIQWFRSSSQLKQTPSPDGRDSNSGKEQDPNEPPNEGGHVINCTAYILTL